MKQNYLLKMELEGTTTKLQHTGESEGRAQKQSTNQNSKEGDSAVIWPLGSNSFFENKSEWLTTAEAATYLRKLSPMGIPSLNAIHKLVSQGKIRRRKFSGRLYFKRKELDYLIESSEA